jgi:hypothetical protein
MLYLENKTTFSGSDIKVYAYRSASDFNNFKDLDERKVIPKNENPLYPDDPFRDMDPNQIDLELDKSLHDIASGRTKFTEQKQITTPFGESKIIDLKDLESAEVQYAAPKFKDLPLEVDVTYGNNNTVRMSPSEAQDEAYMAAQGGYEIDVQPLPQLSVVDYQGETKIVPTDQTYDISANHVPLVVEDAAPKPDYSAVQTNKVNPNYIDIVRLGSDKKALKLARDNQIAKQNANKNITTDSNNNSTVKKPIIELGSLYSITYSSFREKHAVRTLGRVSAKDYTRGQRTIAGSMNFAVFQSHELMDFLKDGQFKNDIVILDQLPKFNLMLVMINEYGGASILHLFGVTISTESQQSSVEDLALMNNITFYAEDIMTIENVGNTFETSLAMLHPTVLAGKTLRFYNKGQYNTLGGLMNINGSSDGRNSKIDSLLKRSRGLF